MTEGHADAKARARAATLSGSSRVCEETDDTNIMEPALRHAVIPCPRARTLPQKSASFAAHPGRERSPAALDMEAMTNVMTSPMMVRYSMLIGSHTTPFPCAPCATPALASKAA